MSARERRQALIELLRFNGVANASKLADQVEEAIWLSWSRILAPGELDTATIEKCQAEVEIACEASASDHDKIRFIRKRLRSLTGGDHA